MKKDFNPKCYMTGCDASGFAVVGNNGEFIERLCGTHIRLKYAKAKINEQIKLFL